MQILWLDDPACQDEAAVGGKAAALARLAAHFRVPPGFCVPIAAFAAWQARGEREAAATLPPEELAALAAAYRQLAIRSGQAEPAVAVRSSALGEDSEAASFAGQFSTELNVIGAEAVQAAVVRCWQSAHSEQAESYRRQHGRQDEGPQMGVFILQMVQADSAAVAFSVNPVTGRQDEVVVEAVRGLGTALVGGTATPARDLLHKQGDALYIVERHPAENPVLSDAQAIEVARLAVALERHEGKPVDVECAYQDGTLYLLQCRPVTAGIAAEAAARSDGDAATMPAVEWDNPADAERTWSGGGLMLPLQQSLSLQYYQGWAKAFRRVHAMGRLRSRIYCGREYRCWEYNDTLPPDEAVAANLALEQQVPQLWAEDWLPLLQRDLTEWGRIDWSQLPDDELGSRLQAMLARQTQHWEIHAVMGWVPLSAVQRLVDWYLARFPDAPESEPYRLVQGQGNTSLESNHLLWAISRELTPDDLASLQRGEWEEIAPSVQAALDSYATRFGGGQAAARQRARQLAIRYAHQAVQDPLATSARLDAERNQFTEEVRNRLTPDERAQFEPLLSCALANHRLTEDHNYWLDNLSNQETRRLCAEFANRLLQTGSFTQVDDSEYLTLAEFIQWAYGLAEPLRPLVAARRAEYARDAALSAPSFLGQPPQPPSGEGYVDRFSGPALPLASAEGEIRGVGASAGQVMARARVVATLDEAMNLQPGEVLVCPATDPSWTPLFALAAALITDQGGSLSHAAVVAREYRLPAVVGTHVATQRIRSGQMVEVDGTTGVVKVRP